MDTRVSLTFKRFDRAELRFCRYLNRSSGYASVRACFAGVSWLGDGKFWYGLMLLLAVVDHGWHTVIQMIATGAVSVLLYKLIKQRAVRERPFITHSTIHCAAAPLDRYSFPSGHTMHAVCFSWICASYHPEWAVPLVAFTLLVALSRVILGLHYPTDVAAGALLGGGLALTSLSMFAPA